MGAGVGTVAATTPVIDGGTSRPANSSRTVPTISTAIAAFATAMAPFAAQAADIDEGVVIGYGAGLVACVVSLAVGFAIGYGTLVKP